MNTVTTSSIPMTSVPFSREEYDRRHAAVFNKMETDGLDVLAVTAYSHLEYLSGYDGSVRV